MVEDLVHASAGPTLLFVVDNIAKDCGISLVRRLKGQQPDLKAMLLVNSQEAYARNAAALEIYDGIAAGSSVGRGGLLACMQAVTQGRRHLDTLLRHVEGVIVPLLTKGLKNREIAAALFIAETTTRDYVSSILSKLQVSNRAAAVAWAIEHGFLGG